MPGPRSSNIYTGAARQQTGSVLRIVAGSDGLPRYVLGPGPEDARFVIGDDGVIRIISGAAPEDSLRALGTDGSYRFTIYGDV